MVRWMQANRTTGIAAIAMLFALGMEPVRAEPCPEGAIPVEQGQSIQAAVYAADRGASFCIKAGVHRLQQVTPLDRQSFFGEPGTIMTGAREVAGFKRYGRAWMATGQTQRFLRNGQCAKGRNCNYFDQVFIDGQPLQRADGKKALKPGFYFIEQVGGRLFIADNPAGRKVEATAARFAFQGSAYGVRIRQIVVEKYASYAQHGAISGRGGAYGWSIEKVEARYNGGAGVSIGGDGRVVDSHIHHNGQLGIRASGRGIHIEGNQIAHNNIHGFDFGWEAGGVKVTESADVKMIGNHVHHNLGPGLWCDIDCRNVLYERNLVEFNGDAGIFHEISFDAVIRNNVTRANGRAVNAWIWGAEIQIAASENVEVHGNSITVAPGGNGIVLIDQNRPSSRGDRYKSRLNRIHGNQLVFEGAGKSGGAADTRPGDENYGIIAEGGNVFDGNFYVRLDSEEQLSFAWGRTETLYDCEGFRMLGQERNGRCDLVSPGNAVAP